MLEVHLLGHLSLAELGTVSRRCGTRASSPFSCSTATGPSNGLRSRSRCGQFERCSGSHNLRRELHALRRALPDAERLLAIERKTIQWRPDGPFHLDVAAFEEAVEHAAGGGVDGLRAAVALYRGDLLPGVYDDWIEPHRDHLRTRMIETLDALATGLEDRREYRAALEQLNRLVTIDPLTESRYQALMRVAALVGDRPAGLRAYHACVSALRDELGIDPSRETLDAYQRLVTLHASDVRAGAGLVVPALPELVGRDPEWKALVDGWNRAVNGALTLALI